MTKKMWSLLLTGALIAGVFSALPARAQDAPPQVPANVQIEDPYGDANTLAGDQVTPADGGSQTDIGKVWLSTTATDINVHFLTEGAPSANSLGFQFVLATGEKGCLTFDGYFDGATYLSENLGRVLDACNGKTERALGSFTFGPHPDGGGIATITVPRNYSPLFQDGATITQPVASTWIFAGGEQLVPSGYRGVRQRIDDTKVGTDYTISGGAPTEPPVAQEPPGQNETPGQGNQDCAKIKDKKEKKACKKNNGKTPPGDKCAAYTPGEAGAEAETLVVTDAATEEAPLELEVETVDGAGVGRGSFGPLVSHAYVNLQVDSSTPTGGLWVKVSFAPYQDYDLYLDPADGSGEVASSGGFGPEDDAEPGDSDSQLGSETLTGIRTNDCGGWTLDIVGATTEGGAVTLTTWLGAELWDPASQAPVGAKAFVF